MVFTGASNKGGWIVKDSYGVNHGDKGYIYVSYDDAGLTKNDNVVFPSIKNLPSAKNISKAYFYDRYGWVDNKGFNSNIGYALVKYMIGNNGGMLPQQIKRIGTYSVEPNTKISVEIYASFNNNVLGELLGSAQITCKYKGCYSIPLQIGSLAIGTEVFIKVKYECPVGVKMTIPVEVAEANHTPASLSLSDSKCWISANGSSWTSVGKNSNNPFDLCVKMYTENSPIAKITSYKTNYIENEMLQLTSENSLVFDQLKWLVNGVVVDNTPSLNVNCIPPFVVGENCVELVASYGSNNDTASVKINVKSLTGNKQLNKGLYEIYPNPSSDVFYIQGDNTELIKVELYSPSGKWMENFENTRKINLKAYAKGEYLIKMIADDYSEVKKVIKY